MLCPRRSGYGGRTVFTPSPASRWGSPAGPSERETALRDQEEEPKRLRKESLEFPTRLQREMEQAATQAAKTATQPADQQGLLLKREAEGDKRIADLQVRVRKNW